MKFESLTSCCPCLFFIAEFNEEMYEADFRNEFSGKTNKVVKRKKKWDVSDAYFIYLNFL